MYIFRTNSENNCLSVVSAVDERFLLEAGTFSTCWPTVSVTSSPFTVHTASMKFICGDPMNPATNRLQGVL